MAALKFRITELFVLTMMFMGCHPSWTTAISIDEKGGGGYRDIVVAISPKIDRSEINDVLSKLEEIFTASSSLLHTATRNISYFEEIVFLLPRGISEDILVGRELSNKSTNYKPDMIVLHDEGMFHGEPYTIQHSNCIAPGLRINIPLDFLKNRDHDLNTKAKMMVHEWAHYHYGVFDEHGFANDELYPLTYSIPGMNKSSRIVTGCTDKVPKYEFKNKYGQKCEEDEKTDSGRCFPVPSDSSETSSSLMHKPFFSKMDQFCDAKTFEHNRKAPTKQNALCRELSTWDVIARHFFREKILDRKVTPKALRFKYIVESRPQMILALETTGNMANKGRMNLVRNAFSYFLLYDVPDESRIGLTDLKADSSLPQLIDVSQSSHKRVLDLFPDAYGAGEVCVHCAILRATKVFSENIGSGCIVIVTTQDIDFKRSSFVQKSMAEVNARLFVIFFPSPDHLNALTRLESLATSSGGKFFMVMEDSEHNQLFSLADLFEVFRLIYKSFSWTNRDNVLIDQRIFYTNDSNTAVLSFDVDDTIGNLRVIMTGPKFNNIPPIVKDSIALQNMNEKYSTLHTSFSHRMSIPAFVFSIDEPQVGKWNLTFQRKSGYDTPLIAIIRGNCRIGNETINIDSYLKWKAMNWNEENVIYAEIRKKNGHPLRAAIVNAIFHHHSTGNEISLELFDHGEGDPDITKNDGVYSRYLTGLNLSGYYTVAINARSDPKNAPSIEIERPWSHCCGSVINSEYEHPNNSLKRMEMVGTIFVTEEFIKKNFPPRRIVDLRITDVQVTTRGISLYTIKWTAPGDDLDNGIVAEHEIKIFRTRKEALKNFDTDHLLLIDYRKIHGPLIQPKQAGSIQSVIIELKNFTTGIYYLAIRTTDSNNISADVSNVVEFYYDEHAYPPDDGTSSKSFTISVSDPVPTQTVEVTTTSGLEADIGFIIGLSFVGLFLLFLLGIFIFVFLNRYEKLYKSRSVDTSAPSIIQRSPVSTSTAHIYTESGTLDVNHRTDHERPTAPSNDTNQGYGFVFKTGSRNNLPVVSLNNPPSIYTIGNAAYQNDDSLYDIPYAHQNQYNMNNFSFNPSYTSSLGRSRENNRSRLGTDV